MDDFKVKEVPASSKSSIPTILKLYPSTASKPALLHANLPLRFGRSSQENVQSPLNLPQRFGRTQEPESPLAVPVPCHHCARSSNVASPSATLPQRFGRTSHSNSRPARAQDVLACAAARRHLRLQGRGSGYGSLDEVRALHILKTPKDPEAYRHPTTD
ncbi:hypothetical protein JZ751_016245 [Albula glossodonta]|uniref:Uncharacterized protein n=1 Tax=Albula glossodonta TaxID=121402 RepID=A0A8T2N2D7_9TELE|nr:hypothetical protein JZ751_016245 [Albula glossodonta]